MIRNSKNTVVFSLIAAVFCLNCTNFYLADYGSKAIAKNSKATRAKDNKIIKGKDPKTIDIQSKNKNSAKTKDTPSDSEGDWRKLSKKAAELIFYHKFVEGDAILSRILPIARKEDPDGIELGICLARYGYGLMGEKKYQQSLSLLAEAFKVTQKTPQSNRQQRALFQILKATATVYYDLNQFNKSEKFARQTLAYRIAFPHISSLQYFRNTYEILRLSLEHQKKSDEAMIISEIVSTLS